jgi:glycosyltransferase involved in cell wall biosynthesis
MLGGLQRVKGALVFLRAAEVVLSQRMDVEFAIAGAVQSDGDQLEREHFAACMEYVSRMEKSGRLRMIGSVADPYPLLHASTIVIAPSTESHFSRPIIEAWSCGKPVIASSTAHHLDLMTDGVDGCLVKIGDHNDVAGHILSLIADPEKCERLGRAGKNRATTEFDAGKNTTALLACCEEVLTPHRGTTA